MNRSYVNELRRTALSRYLVALAIVGALAGGLALLPVPASSAPPSIATVYYYADGAYHVIGYVYDADGGPVAGATVVFSSPQGLPPGSPTGGTTNAAGIVEAAFPSAYNNETYIFSVTTSAGSAAIPTEVSNYPYALPAGTIVPGFGDMVPIDTGTYDSTGSLLVFYAGPNGTPPDGYRVQYYFPQLETATGASASASAQEAPTGSANYSVATLSGYAVLIPLRIAAPPNASFGADVTVQILRPSGTVATQSGFPPEDFGPQAAYPAATLAAGLALSEIGLAGLVIGLLAGLALYGNDRLSGALEPYLVRRVSAPGLLASRYVGALLPIAAATTVSVFALDAGLAERFGAPMPAGLLLVALGACLASVAAWLAVPFALAHATRTVARLTTAVTAVLAVFAFLWTPLLVALAPYLGAGPGTSAAAPFDFGAGVVNSALAPSTLVPDGIVGAGAATVAGVVAVAFLWIALPLGFALYRARTAD